ncbi:MAG: radical SAM protein [Candidatus Woesearchaeota archaeon]
MDSPLINKSWNKNINKLAIVYPNLKYGGSYSLAPLIIYNLVNSYKNWICERFFLDESNLKDQNLIGFTFQYEPDYYNFFKILKQNNISLNKERSQIIFAGGPCINQNPSTLSKYLDFMCLGEIENIIPLILKEYEKDNNKEQFLKNISKIPGIYIPELNKPIFNNVKNLDDYAYPLYQPFPNKITKDYVFGKVFILEIERGCPFNCAFCPVHKFYPVVKYRSLNKIKEIIDQGISINKRDKVVIYSPSFTHPQRKEILKYLISKNLKFSVPSLKIELIDEELLNLIKQGSQKTLTVAPECNESLRYSIGKPVKDELFFNFAKLASKLQFKTLKLYFMIGLPNQKEKDLDEIINFINEMKSLFNNIYISINPFVPKPNTAFSEHKFDKKIIKQQVNYLKKNLKVKFKIPNLDLSYKEYKLANLKEIKERD